ncbi:DEAD/DEAH box helicase [Cohnella endophytica]|uniref:DEAD/DEAH box helicase n=1 Tax=Cohnella endophytica TaxID=2419778 RepID=A0A494XKZ6_9BACL|nr:DEAD/DEAH box helicase [Cohnella endophytica]RKP51377.1 DEAD/DEAH box helicase [Cohnella endophytica]
MTDFAKLGVSEGRVAILKENGIVTPTPVQEETIPVVKEGYDVISQAQTGTGKTLAFVLPMLDKIRADAAMVQGLILTPTRELAIQITAEIKKLLTREDGIKVLAVYGGQDVEAQLHKLKGDTHIVVATPGRLLDHLRRETITLGGVKMLVLDEADQMLHMGFIKDVEEILNQTPYKKQAMLFSATMPPSIREMAGRILRSPKHITVKTERVTVKDIRQWVVETSDRAKQDTLVKLLETTQPYLSIIFCRTKRRASTLNEALQEMGYSSDELHGDLSQMKREQVMKRFRDARLQLLVATDVAARGLDVEGVTHVFNYDVPLDVESYIHRIGRTGRAGEKGLAITLIAPKDRREFADIENGIQMAMERRSEEGAPLGGGGLEGPRSSGGLGRPGGKVPRSRGGSGEGGGRSGGRASGAGSRSAGSRSAGVGSRTGGSRAGTGERAGAGAGRGRGSSAGGARGGDRATAFGGAGEGRRGAPASAAARPAGASSRASRAGEYVEQWQSREAAKAERSSSDAARGGKSAGGASRRNSTERLAAGRVGEKGGFERREERGGRSGGGAGFGGGRGGRSEGPSAGAGFSKGGRKSDSRSSGGSSFGGGRPSSGGRSGGGFKGPKGPAGGGRSGGRGASRGR